jgi:hypothetical protein
LLREKDCRKSYRLACALMGCQEVIAGAHYVNRINRKSN